MVKKCLFLILSLCCLYGCQRDLPEPEVQVFFPMESFVASHENLSTLDVRYFIDKNKLYIECLTPNISFNNQGENQGKILLFINGTLKKEFWSAAFIVKDLPKGRHHIRLEVVKLNNEPYQLTKEFTINIT